MSSETTSAIKQVRIALKQERENLSLTRKEVCEALEWAPGKLARIEDGPSAISIAELQALLFQYNVTDRDYSSELKNKLEESKNSAWWQVYEDRFAADFLKFIDFESSAILVRQFSNLLIPGLLQTPEYATAVISTGSNAVVEEELEIRLRRQHVLEGDDSSRFSFVITEAALTAGWGDSELTRRQLLHLKTIIQNTKATIRIIPLSRMGMLQGYTSFQLFDLPREKRSRVLMFLGMFKDKIVEKDEGEIEKHHGLFAEISDLAFSLDDSLDFIHQLVNRL